MKNIIKVINTKDHTVSKINIDKNATSANPLVIKAQPNSSYEFFAPSIGKAPNELIMTRNGNDLKIRIKIKKTDKDEDDSVIIIKDYYTHGEGDLTGIAEDNQYYSYVPEEVDSNYIASNLDDGITSFQALGEYDEIAAIPWWSLGALAPLAALGGGGRDNNTAPVAIPSTPSGDEDTNIPIALAGTDKDGTIVSVNVTTLPPETEGVLYYSDGVTPVSTSTPLTPSEAASLVFVPATNFNDTVTIPFTVTDNDGATSPIAYEVITVDPVNDDFTDNNETVATDEDTTATGNVIDGTSADGPISVTTF
ncbi:hypothetical protein, partial [Sulfurimonas sp.]